MQRSEIIDHRQQRRTRDLQQFLNVEMGGDLRTNRQKRGERCRCKSVRLQPARVHPDHRRKKTPPRREAGAGRVRI